MDSEKWQGRRNKPPCWLRLGGFDLQPAVLFSTARLMYHVRLLKRIARAIQRLKYFRAFDEKGRG